MVVTECTVLGNVCFSHFVLASTGFVQLPGGGGDAALCWGEGGGSAGLQSLEEGRLALPRWTDHEHLKQLTGLCFSKLCPEESQHTRRT